MSTLEVYDKLLLDKRSWISKIPDNKKAAMLVSGGYDSMITSARLIKDFGMELFSYLYRPWFA